MTELNDLENLIVFRKVIDSCKHTTEEYYEIVISKRFKTVHNAQKYRKDLIEKLSKTINISN